MKIRSVLSFLILLPFSTVQAAPHVSALNGTILDGQSLSVSGSGFGSKSAGAPIIWDTLENGQFHSSWGSKNDLTITSSGQRHGRSLRSGFLNFSGAAMNGDFRASDTTHARWFVQYWFKVDNNWDWGSTTYDGNNRFLSNIKIFRMWNPGDVNENFVVAMNGWDNVIEFVMENVGGEPRRTFMGDFKSTITRGSWHLFQFEYTDNSSVGASDGQFRCWFDGRLVANQTNIKTREDSSATKRPFIIGFSNVWEPGGGESEETPNHFYIDDVYVDNTWARVELGNRPIYGDCTVREIQPVTSWSDNGVQIRVNAGGFGNNQTAYLYVVNANGEVNPTGVPVTVGGAIASTYPGGGGEGEGTDSPDLPVAIDKKSTVIIKPSEQQNAKISYLVNSPTNVKISVQQRFGEEVRTLEETHKTPGVYQVEWNGANGDGSMAASGIYLIVFETSEQTLRQKVVLIK